MSQSPKVESVDLRWSPDHESVGQHAAENCDACRDGRTPEGCRAIATVSYSIGGGSRRLETLTSGGLWGICGADEKYRHSVELDELSDLAGHLAHFGINATLASLQRLVKP